MDRTSIVYKKDNNRFVVLFIGTEKDCIEYSNNAACETRVATAKIKKNEDKNLK